MVEKPKTRAALTTRQREIYDFLKDKILNRGYGPTVREIGTQFGIRSPNGVMCHLKALERKGLISREAHMSRAIQLADPPPRRMSLPLAGQIAAGAPVLAEEQTERVDFGALFDVDDHFCLKVKGDSMIEEQIADGDYVGETGILGAERAAQAAHQGPATQVNPAQAAANLDHDAALADDRLFREGFPKVLFHFGLN